MTVEKIEIGKSVEALHEWHKLSLTVSILPGEDPQLIHKEAKELLDKLLPGIDSQQFKATDDIPVVKDPIAGHVMAINSASNLAALNWHRTLVEKEGDNHPELREAFDNKLKQLQ